MNERDEIGPDLVPDYLTMVQEGAFYGWPYSYWGQHVDVRVHPQRPDLVAKAVKPDYGLSSHVAALGLAFTAPARCLSPMIPATPYGASARISRGSSQRRANEPTAVQHLKIQATCWVEHAAGTKPAVAR